MALQTVSVSWKWTPTSQPPPANLIAGERWEEGGDRNSRTRGVRKPEEMGLEREAWSQSWMCMEKREEPGKGLSWIHFCFN